MCHNKQVTLRNPNRREIESLRPKYLFLNFVRRDTMIVDTLFAVNEFITLIAAAIETFSHSGIPLTVSTRCEKTRRFAFASEFILEY